MASTLGKHILISQCTVYENLISEFYRVCFKVFPPSVLFCDIITLLIMTNWKGSNEKTKRERQKQERKREKKALFTHVTVLCPPVRGGRYGEISFFCLSYGLFTPTCIRGREREKPPSPPQLRMSQSLSSPLSLFILSLSMSHVCNHCSSISSLISSPPLRLLNNSISSIMPLSFF